MGGVIREHSTSLIRDWSKKGKSISFGRPCRTKGRTFSESFALSL